MYKYQKPTAHYESLEQRYERYRSYFVLHQEQLIRMYQSFLKEIQCALESHKESSTRWHPEKCSMMFFDTCITHIPTGHEKGIFYGVDFGGTNLRVVRVELDGNGNSISTKFQCNIRGDENGTHLDKGLLDKEATASMLFTAIAKQIKRLMQENGDINLQEPMNIGLTFSFAIQQHRLDSAILTGWSKGFETGIATQDGVIGRDVCRLLAIALKEIGVPTKIVASLNDTTGTMLSAAYELPQSLPPCLMGVILGTGVNACYYEPDAFEYGYISNIINTECGEFDKNLPWNIIDSEIDFVSTNRGRGKLEKMISGLYIPELCRRLVIKVFQNEAPKEAWTHGTMPGEYCGAIIADESSDLGETKAILNDIWFWSPSQESVETVKTLFAHVFDRSAALAAVMIAALAKKTGMLQPAIGGLTVGVDGSLYTQNKLYREMLSRHLKAVIGEEMAALIHFFVVEGGSGRGAAILAGVTE